MGCDSFIKSVVETFWRVRWWLLIWVVNLLPAAILSDFVETNGITGFLVGVAAVLVLAAFFITSTVIIWRFFLLFKRISDA